MKVGPFVRRKHKAMANAAEWLEPGEHVLHGVMVNTGPGVLGVQEAILGDAMTGQQYPRVSLLVLTDRSIRVFSVPTWTALSGQAVQFPLAGAHIELKRGFPGPAVVVNGQRFDTVPFRKNRRDARRLVEAAGGTRG